MAIGALCCLLSAASAPKMVFTSANWATPQSSVVFAQEDEYAEGMPHYTSIVHDVSGDDATVATLEANPVSITVSIMDNRMAGYVVGQVAGPVPGALTCSSLAANLISDATCVSQCVSKGALTTGCPTGLCFCYVPDVLANAGQWPTAQVFEGRHGDRFTLSLAWSCRRPRSCFPPARTRRWR